VTNTDPETLLRRIASLERETRRAFEEAQNEADAMFAQYQLSQLLTSGGPLSELASAVLVEVIRLCEADGAALWMAGSGSQALRRIAVAGSAPAAAPLPEAFVDAGEALTWSTAEADRFGFVVGEAPTAGLLAVWLAETSGAGLDPDSLRIVQLSRHELAVAFRSAQLRGTLERERDELTAIVDGATDAIIQVDEACLVVRLNPAAERLLGLDQPAALGRPCHEILGCAAAGGHAEDACPLAEVVAIGEPIGYRETAVVGDQGIVVRAAGGYSRASSGPGGAVRATAILRDISAASALEELREGFVATVSHELRTPIALIRGYAETLLHLELSAADQRHYVERIQQTTERLTALVTDILDITHLDADPLILERAPVALSSLVARLRGDLAITGREDRLVLDIPANLPPLEVDGPRVGQVLENLVGNAMKYSPPGSPILVVAEVEGEWCRITVDDDGPGVPASDRVLVLEPFHRARNVRESSIPGTGLGLYIARRLVEAHGGRLWLSDRPDEAPGTRVNLTLPLLPPARVTASRQPRGRAAAGVGEASGG
jgi:PAS domain S-box-containing protein